MSKNNHIDGCVYTAEILAYLYGEIGKREKFDFETHLPDCTNCTDALADSAFALFSVKEWRDTEFAHLETPVINVPYLLEKEIITDASVSDSWLARLRRYVSLSPAWATAGGAMAALAIGIGLVFAAMNISQTAEIAEVNKQNPAETAISPTTEIVVQNPTEITSGNQKPESNREQPPDSPDKNIKSIKPEMALKDKSFDSSENTVVKLSDNARKNKIVKQISEDVSANNRVDGKTTNKAAASKPRQAPGLVNFEDEEDNTLRLAELFEETDTEK
ncbi:MAG TPA: hypothetical protein VGD05_12600 [Pyrinomonadaceae bacterium]|jgi:hypothetical protein